MAFGMINSAATLKSAMKKLIEDLDDVDFYWDDILVQTRTWEERIRVPVSYTHLTLPTKRIV